MGPQGPGRSLPWGNAAVEADLGHLTGTGAEVATYWPPASSLVRPRAWLRVWGLPVLSGSLAAWASLTAGETRHPCVHFVPVGPEGPSVRLPGLWVLRGRPSAWPRGS